MEWHNKLHNLIKGSMMMDKYIKKIRTINKELTVTVQVIDELIIMFTFLSKLLSKYTPFITGLNICP